MVEFSKNLFAVPPNHAEWHVYRGRSADCELLEELPNLRPLWGDEMRKCSSNTVWESQDSLNPFPSVEDELVAWVSPKEFVGAFPGEDNLDVVLGRELANEVKRDTDRIRERLVLVVDEAREEIESLLLGNGHLMMIGAKVLRDSLCLGALVELRMIPETN